MFIVPVLVFLSMMMVLFFLCFVIFCLLSVGSPRCKKTVPATQICRLLLVAVMCFVGCLLLVCVLFVVVVVIVDCRY